MDAWRKYSSWLPSASGRLSKVIGRCCVRFCIRGAHLTEADPRRRRDPPRAVLQSQKCRASCDTWAALAEARSQGRQIGKGPSRAQVSIKEPRYVGQNALGLISIGDRLSLKSVLSLGKNETLAALCRIGLAGFRISRLCLSRFPGCPNHQRLSLSDLVFSAGT